MLLLWPHALRHVVGLFGVCDASTAPMLDRLARNKSCVLYIGGAISGRSRADLSGRSRADLGTCAGIAEIFLSRGNGSEETIYAAKRKVCPWVWRART